MTQAEWPPPPGGRVAHPAAGDGAIVPPITAGVVSPDGDGAPGRRSDVSVLASRSMLTLVGGVASGVLGFLAVFVVAHGLGASRTGSFFEGVSLFSIATQVLLLGSDIALLRFVAADRAGRHGATRHILATGLVPVAVVSLVATAVIYAAVPWLADHLRHGASPAQLTVYLRALVIALPISVAYNALIPATRAFGTVKPFVVIDRIVRPALQVALLLVVVVAGLGALALAGAWVVPIGLALVWTLSWTWRRLRREPIAREPVARRALAWTFWRFSMPRGLAGMFQVLITWLDTLLIGFYLPSRDVAIYTASTRYVLLVGFVGIAITQAVAPQLGDLLARRAFDRAESVFRVATVWNVAVTWPMLVVLAIFAPVLLGLFPHAYKAGADATRIFAISMLVGSGVGMVDWVLLMEGKSSWNLLNTAVALVLNVGLNIVLIPHFGIAGAAVAWAASILANNILPAIEVRRFIGISPFCRIHTIVCVASVACFAVPGLAFVALFGQTLPAFVGASVVSSVAYLIVLWRVRDEIQAPALWDALRRRKPAPVRTG